MGKDTVNTQAGKQIVLLQMLSGQLNCKHYFIMHFERNVYSSMQKHIK